MIIDEENGFYIDPIDIKNEVLTKINKKHLIFNGKYRDDNIEKMKIPLFTPFLLEMIYNSDEIPSFIEFFEKYCSENLKDIDEFITYKLEKLYLVGNVYLAEISINKNILYIVFSEADTKDLSYNFALVK